MDRVPLLVTVLATNYLVHCNSFEGLADKIVTIIVPEFAIIIAYCYLLTKSSEMFPLVIRGERVHSFKVIGSMNSSDIVKCILNHTGIHQYLQCI